MTVLDQGKNALFLLKREETQVQEVEIIERQIGAENSVSLRGVIRRLLENGRNRKQLEDYKQETEYTVCFRESEMEY